MLLARRLGVCTRGYIYIIGGRNASLNLITHAAISFCVRSYERGNHSAASIIWYTHPCYVLQIDKPLEKS